MISAIVATAATIYMISVCMISVDMASVIVAAAASIILSIHALK
jgi:hypothetical protein